MRRMGRMPQIGDMIIETCPHRNNKHVGLVREINIDSYGHQRNVYIEWSGESPQLYNSEHGYAGVNIHNIRSRFDVIRNGINIR